MSEEDSLLTNLCAICHTQPPKYRCPRCSTRTCSLPCTRRHKLWSECSGIRDPAAYLRRGELATESAFDRDFNFITGIERRLERAEREAENRGVRTDVRVRDAEVVGLSAEDFLTGAERETKRRKGNGNGNWNGGGGEAGFMKGEMGFLKRAQEAGVRVVQAPRGMSRAKGNGSRWHPRQKCLHWTVEWVTDTDGGKKMMNSSETNTIAEAYDRAFPLQNEERDTKRAAAQEDKDRAEQTIDGSDVPKTTETESKDTAPESSNSNGQSGHAGTEIPSETSGIKPHRNLYFYLHSPRTATKLPVLCPLPSDTTLSNALRGRMVLEFPTIYVLQSPLDSREDSKYILEDEYLRTHPDTEPEVDEASEDTDQQPPFGAMDIPDVDEGKVLEVLRKDLLGTAPAAGTPQ